MNNKHDQINTFGSLEFESKETVNMFIDEMTKEQSLFVISESLKYSHKKGVFSLLESEMVSKALRIVSDSLSDGNE